VNALNRVNRRADRVRPWHAVGLAALLGGATPGAAEELSDSPYVPTPQVVVDKMLEIAGVGRGDYVIDLGSGDGRIVITAAKKFGAHGLGVDIDAALVNTARRAARRQGVSEQATFQAQNLFITDISRASVVTMYLFPQVIMQLRPRLLTELRPGARVVSHDFHMDNWRPDAKVTLPVPDKPHGPPSSDVFLWIVPADAAGTWRWRQKVAGVERDYELRLEQTYQVLRGQARLQGGNARPGAGRMRGENISFTFTAEMDGREVRHEFIGRVAGDAISGTVRLGHAATERFEWKAVRTARGKMDIRAETLRPSPPALPRGVGRVEFSLPPFGERTGIRRDT
jgi:hypothetical protein